MERADGILSESRYFELIDPYFEDPYDLVAKSSFAYEPGKLSKIYKSSPAEIRKEINEETDKEFRRLINFTGTLDPGNPEHQELISKWLRMRDVVMELKYGEKGEREKVFLIEARRFNVGPSEVQHDWKNDAKITTSFELDISSASINSTSLPYEAARAVSDDKALSEFARNVNQGLSSPKIELFEVGDVVFPRFIVLDIQTAFIGLCSTTLDPLTKEPRPALDFSRESRLHFLLNLRQDKVYSFREWKMSKPSGVLRIQIYIEPISH